MPVRSSPKTSRGIFETLGDDIRKGEHVQTIRKDYRDIHNFYFTDAQRDTLRQKYALLRPMYIGWWLLRGMFDHLPPTRRLLLVTGLFFGLNGLAFRFGDFLLKDNGLLGFALILFVLVLELKDKVLAHQELESGRLIQRALMPERCPFLDGWNIGFDYRPAREVGGDLVDCLELDASRCGFVVADVAGKGLRAALLAAKLQSTVRAIATDYRELGALCARVNTIFHRDSVRSIFASLMYLELTSGRGNVSFVNAGHLPPLLLTGSGVRELGKGQIALGLSPHSSYINESLMLEPGDILLVFTDGLSEAANAEGQLYGTERIKERLWLWRQLSADEIIQSFHRDIERFTRHEPARDDKSLLVIRRT